MPLGGKNTFFHLSAAYFEQQTALAAFLAVSLLGFEKPCFFKVTDPAADGGWRILEVGGYGRDGRPAFVILICPVGKINIYRNGSVRQMWTPETARYNSCLTGSVRTRYSFQKSARSKRPMRQSGKCKCPNGQATASLDKSRCYRAYDR